MGTKPAQLQRGEIMWLRANGAQLRPGQQCWVLADLQKPGLSVHVHMDDGSGRPRDIQLEDPAGTRRWVTRGALVALGCATWFRESRVYRPSQQVRTLTPAQAAAAELAAGAGNWIRLSGAQTAQPDPAGHAGRGRRAPPTDGQH